MKRKIIIDFTKNDIMDRLFSIREEEMEIITEDEKKFVEQNNLKDITHEKLINQIKDLNSINEKTKINLLGNLDKLLENRSRLCSYSCKKYYIAGINDMISILFNEKMFCK